jgi:ABC-type multidrug transport system fused ATPase/permease subunit
MAFHDKITASFELLRRLLFLVRPYGLGKAAVVLVVMLLQGLLQVAGVTSIFPFLALATNPEGFRSSGIGQRVLGLLPPLDNSQLLLWAGVISILTLVASNAVNLLSDYVRARYAHSLAHWLRLQLLSRIASQPWSYFLQRNSAVLLKKSAGDVRFMTESVLMPILEAMTRLVTAVCLVLLIVLVDWRVALVAAASLVAFYAAVLRLIQSKRRSLSAQFKVADRGVMREAHQLLGGMKTVKIRHAERHFLERFAIHSKDMATILSKSPMLVHSPKYLLEPIAFGAVIVAVLAHAGAEKDLAAILPLAGVMGLAGYRLLPAMQLVYTQIVQALLCRHAVDEVYDEMCQVPAADGVVWEPSPEPLRWNREIAFENVSFTYGDASDPVLRGLSFSLPKHSSLAVVGATGSGKSTLVDLLMGLHLPTAGMIAVDGKPLDEAMMRSWQAGIGYVPQDIFLIDDTITRNIALGVADAEIDMERVVSSAGAARIREFIETELPDGFDTLVGERGLRLSGGQRQRIALARALYTQPNLLILDEATSALDNQTEAEVTEAISNLKGRVTMVVVAHRLSTVENCEYVLPLKDGCGEVVSRSRFDGIPTHE